MHKMLRLVVNTLTVDDKYYAIKTDNLTQPVHMQLSQKQKIVHEFFSIFELYIKFGTFSNKDDPHS